VRNGARFAGKRAEVRQNGRPEQAARHASTKKLRKVAIGGPLLANQFLIFFKKIIIYLLLFSFLWKLNVLYWKFKSRIYLLQI